VEPGFCVVSFSPPSDVRHSEELGNACGVFYGRFFGATIRRAFAPETISI
jgi:hypothetical protein